MPTRLLAIALIAGFATACTGSSGDPKPSPSPSTHPATSSAVTSTSPSPTRTGPLTTGPNVRPGEKPPLFPPQARARTEMGALQFAGYYFKALDWAIATNDDYPIRQVAAPHCGSCKLVYAGLAKLQARGQKQIGGRIRVLSAVVELKHYNVRYDFVFRIEYSEDAATLVSRDGSRKLATHAVSRASSLVFVAWLSGAWRVLNVTSA